MNIIYIKVITFITTVVAGGIFFYLYSKYYSKLPKIRKRSIEIFPSIRIHISGRIIHLHHWFNFLILLTISVFVNEGLLASLVIKGFCTGGIIQGIFLPGKEYGRRLMFKGENR